MPACPLYPKFVFMSTCKVTRCIHNSKSINNGCIMLSRKESDNGAISDEEIAFYKGLSKKDFDKEKSKVLSRAQTLLILHKYLEFIDTLAVSTPVSISLDEEFYFNMVKTWPLNVKELRVDKRRFSLLYSKNSWKDFKRSFGREIPELHEILAIEESLIPIYRSMLW